MGMEDFGSYVHYDIVRTTIGGSKSFRANCSTIMFRNLGTLACIIDDMELFPGETLVWEGYPGEMNIHTYDVTFASGAGTKKLWVGMKVYQNTGVEKKK